MNSSLTPGDNSATSKPISSIALSARSMPVFDIIRKAGKLIKEVKATITVAPTIWYPMYMPYMLAVAKRAPLELSKKPEAKSPQIPPARWTGATSKTSSIL